MVSAAKYTGRHYGIIDIISYKPLFISDLRLVFTLAFSGTKWHFLPP